MLARLFLTALLLACPAIASAQERTAGAILGQTPETKSLPIFAGANPEARQALGDIARAAESGVFMVGKPTGYGTAWVISKKHRLLVTNAHVADIFYEHQGTMIAIPSGSSQVYKVEKVWYHPGLRRFLKAAKELSVRVDGYQPGIVDTYSPDLAIFQLSAEGPDLQMEFAPATAAEVASAFAQPAAIMGYPGHDNDKMPDPGEKAGATYHDGVVSKVTDFKLSTSAPANELLYLQYTMNTWTGFSGSPVFLPNGRVIAVHNAARPEKDRDGQIKRFPHGVRIDTVLEMFVHHKLADKLPFSVDKWELSVDRWSKPDARTEQALASVAKAQSLVDQAIVHYNAKRYQQGLEKCDDALESVPTFAAGYSWRAALLFGLWRNSNFATRKALEILSLALKDAKTANQLAPSADEVLQICRIGNAITWETKDTTHCEETIKVMDRFLQGDNLREPQLRADAFNLRANSYDQIDEDDAAIRDFTEAIRLQPDNPRHYEGRAEVYQSNGQGRLAAADYAKAKKLREGDVQVLWQGTWYPATVLKKDGERYHIHYVGYGAEWDEWVTKERIRFTK